tara:strand:- start:408 stop:578 length:171 start_codon:yes stop_codon:yes gene_type:complete
MTRDILAEAWHDCVSARDKLKALDEFYFSTVHEDTVKKLDDSLHTIAELLRGDTRL